MQSLNILTSAPGFFVSSCRAILTSSIYLSEMFSSSSKRICESISLSFPKSSIYAIFLFIVDSV